MYKEERKIVRDTIEEPSGKYSVGKLRPSWENNIGRSVKDVEKRIEIRRVGNVSLSAQAECSHRLS